MRSKLSVALGLVSALILVGTSVADGLMSVPVSQGVRVNLPGEAKAVVVGNPSIADANLVNARTLVVVGKNPGITNIVVIGKDGRTLLERPFAVDPMTHGQVVLYKGKTTETFTCADTCTKAQAQAAFSFSSLFGF